MRKSNPGHIGGRQVLSTLRPTLPPYYYQIQQQLLTTWRKYNDFAVCSIKDSIEVVCQMKTGILYFLNSPVFGDLIMLLKYARALAHTEMSPDPETGRCRINEACPLSSYHLSCLKLRGVPKKWQCPLCHKNSFTQELKKLGEQWWRSGETHSHSHQCGLGSISRLGVICGLSLLVLFSALRCFSPGTLVFPSSQKPAFD